MRWSMAVPRLVVALVPTLAACSDNTLSTRVVGEAAPSCAVVSPEADDELSPGEPVPLCVVLSDGDTPVSELTVTWSSDLDGELGTGEAVDAEGQSCVSVALSAGSHALDAVAVDPEGLSGSCTGSAEVEASAELGVAIDPQEPATGDDLVATASELPDGTSSDDLQWAWTVDGTAVEALTDDTVPAEQTSRGEVWSVRVSLAETQAQADVTIRNTPPETPAPWLDPEPPVETLDGLSCGLDELPDDADGDAVSVVFTWMLDGEVWTGEVESLEHPGDALSVALLDEDQEWTCSVTASDGADDSEPGTTSTTVEERRWEQVTAGTWHVCARDDVGRVSCWGQDDNGQVSTTPSEAGFVDIQAGWRHTCGLLDTGELRCWGIDDGGDYDKGQVGDVPGGTGWHALGVAGSNNCAVDSSGALQCWGNDDDGRSDPPGGSDWVEVAGGVSWLCAADSAGDVSCWGEHANGVGDGPGEALHALAGGVFACGLRTDETALCWGSDSDGQITDLPSGTFVELSPGERHGCGVRTDETLACWGTDHIGEASPPSGTFLSVGASFQSGDETDFYSCGVDTEHELHCWGSDVNGQQSDIP